MPYFFILNDILYNSSNSSLAWQFRPEIEGILPKMTYLIWECLISTEGKLTAKHYTDIILNVIKLWKQWGAFSTDFLNGLELSLSYQPSFNCNAILSSTRINKLKEIGSSSTEKGKALHKAFGVYETKDNDFNYSRLIYVCSQIYLRDKNQYADASKLKTQLSRIKQKINAIDATDPDGDYITLEDVGNNLIRYF